MEQDKVSKQTEGDNWFKRNKKALNKESLKKDIVLKVIDLFNIKPEKVLELGCANGYRLDYLRDKYDCKCAVGVDCSKMAIEDGKCRYGKIKLFCGGIDHLNLKDSYFDLVIVNFVFHWVDRSVLSLALTETDRVLKKEGLLIVGDFFPLSPVRVPYHHVKDKKIYTYKEDYSKMFEKIGCYQNVGRVAAEHDSLEICADVNYHDRIKIDLLKKYE